MHALIQDCSAPVPSNTATAQTRWLHWTRLAVSTRYKKESLLEEEEIKKKIWFFDFSSHFRTNQNSKRFKKRIYTSHENSIISLSNIYCNTKKYWKFDHHLLRWFNQKIEADIHLLFFYVLAACFQQYLIDDHRVKKIQHLPDRQFKITKIPAHCNVHARNTYFQQPSPAREKKVQNDPSS